MPDSSYGFERAKLLASRAGWELMRCSPYHFQLWGDEWMLNLYPTTGSTHASPPGGRHRNEVPAVIVEAVDGMETWNLVGVVRVALKYRRRDEDRHNEACGGRHTAVRSDGVPDGHHAAKRKGCR